MVKAVLMRKRFLAVAAAALALPSAAAAQSGQDALSLFAERTAVLAVDGRCGMLRPEVRAALQAATGQAHSVLIRAGWQEPRLDSVRRQARQTSATRACADPAVLDAARDAEAAFEQWAATPAFLFHGEAAEWAAFRSPFRGLWRLVQPAPERDDAAFGVIDLTGDGGAPALALRLPAGVEAPAFAEIAFRDAARSPTPFLGVPGEARAGLARRVAPAGFVRTALASQRQIVRRADGGSVALFYFPDTVLAAAADLDPREAFQVRAGGAAVAFEVGDLAAARAFLAAQRPASTGSRTRTSAPPPGAS
jgi:hypothetical protein